jgi:peptidoglycan/LPS O-acetylase OafA/YrhL
VCLGLVRERSEGALDRNRIIDGWRGVSVLLVISGHLIGWRFAQYFETKPFRFLLTDQPLDAIEITKNIILRALSPLPDIGVGIFFIISGYIITGLLLKEETAQGSISIKAFYIRRACRIIPAFYTFLLATFILSSIGVIEVQNARFLQSGLFLCNVMMPCTWFLGHTWSLSVEEQFYLIWPLVFFILGQKWRAAGLGLISVALFVTSLFASVAAPFVYIAIGGLFSLSMEFRDAINKLAVPKFITVAAELLLSVRSSPHFPFTM